MIETKENLNTWGDIKCIGVTQVLKYFKELDSLYDKGGYYTHEEIGTHLKISKEEAIIVSGWYMGFERLVKPELLWKTNVPNIRGEEK
jgi:hypothetical protein